MNKFYRSSSLQTEDVLDQVLGAGLVHSFQRSKHWLFLLPLVFAAAAYAGTYLLNERWAASGVVQVGTVGSVSGGLPQPVEPLARSIERLRLKPFQDLLLRELGIPSDEYHPVARLFRRTLGSRQVTTDIIEVSVHAPSKAEAASWVDTIIQRLQAIHAQIADPHVQQLKVRLETLKADFERATADRKRVLALLTAHGGREDSAGSTLAVLAMLQGMELNTLERTLAIMEEQLGPMYTRPTLKMFEVGTAEEPVYPNRGRAALLGGLIGLLAALTLILVRGMRASAAIPKG